MTIKEVTAYKRDEDSWCVTENRERLLRQEREEVFNKYLSWIPSYTPSPDYFNTRDLWKKEKITYTNGFEEGYDGGFRSGTNSAKDNFLKFYDQIMAELKEIK